MSNFFKIIFKNSKKVDIACKKWYHMSMKTPLYRECSDSEFIEKMKKATCRTDAMRLLGYVCTSGDVFRRIEKRIHELNIDISHWAVHKIPCKDEIPPEEYFVKGQSIRSTFSLKKKVLKYDICDYVCAKCGNTGTWRGKPLTLQLHHKDGDRRNNEPENLEFLCPNCHTQTDNFAGKNQYKDKKIKKSRKRSFKRKLKKKKEFLISRKTGEQLKPNVLKRLLEKENGNFTKVAKELGYTDNAIKKWCVKYGMSKYSKDYRKKSEIYDLTEAELIKLVNSTSKNKICKEYHISKDKLNKILNEHSIVLEKKSINKPVKLISPDGEEFVFESTTAATKFLVKKLNYKKNSMMSNIRKILKGILNNIYGWKAEYL